jgi:hypothetical protein
MNAPPDCHRCGDVSESDRRLPRAFAGGWSGVKQSLAALRMRPLQVVCGEMFLSTVELV